MKKENTSSTASTNKEPEFDQETKTAILDQLIKEKNATANLIADVDDRIKAAQDKTNTSENSDE
jgi:hypothetical protein